MEGFLYDKLNHCIRSKNKDYIKYFGPFAAAISYIIYHANNNLKHKMSGINWLYRGEMAPLELVEKIRDQVDSSIYLLGYTATSTRQYVAYQFATRRMNKS